ncbi:MAG: hypothetical protein OXC79_12525 [Candidatus Poribacteria bacterium]|nr:hypothetical protein [Candidatus Poribacteria bacterium]
MSWFSDIIDRWTLKRAYKWGEGRAKTKLLNFYILQDAYPETPVEDLYYLTVLTSHGFNEHRTRQLIKRAKEQAEGHMSIPGYSDLKVSMPTESFCLRSVIKMMLSAEESQLMKGKGFPHPDGIFEAWKAVDDVIPADL